MKPPKVTTIFALQCGGEIYVGKTTCGRISAVYHRHCRGEIRATKVFSTLGMKPKLHILQRDSMEPYKAYQWVVAYVCFFQVAGYDMLNGVKTIERADNLHSETQQLLAEIQKETADQLLSRTLVTKPSAADMCHAAEETICLTPPNQKLTIRLSKWEKDRFDELAESMHLSQRQTLQYLVSKRNMPDDIFPPLDEDFYIRTITGALREENEKLRTENEKLMMFRDNEKPQLETLRKGLMRYFGEMEAAHPIPLAIPCGRYKGFEGADKYQYPEQTDPFIFWPTVILTGKGRYPAKFILGSTDDGTLLKFRYYPRTKFSGVNPANATFSRRGSAWVVGCERASDGAMDLAFAFPLDVSYASCATKTSDSTAQELLSNILGRDTTGEC